MMERYSEYKDSGVKWLGEIPSHWEVVRLKNAFLKRISGSWGEEPNRSQRNTICLRIADFEYNRLRFQRKEEYTVRSYTINELDEKKLRNGDLLIEKSGGGEKTPVGRCVVYDLEMQDIMYANFMEKLSPREFVNSYYMCYLLSCLYNQGMIWPYVKATTGIQNLDINSLLAKEYVFLPPKSEQDAIARYLDTATSEIDKAIAMQQKMIDLLNERKQIIIQNAVTKGLDENVEMKESGVEWIGRIPKHWEVRRGKFLFRVVNEYSTTGQEELLTVSDRTGITPRSMKNVNMFMSESLIGYKKCQKGDICSNIMWMWHGAVGVTEYNGVISPSYGVYRQIAVNYDNKYLDYMLRLPRLVEVYGICSTGLTESRLRLYPDDFMNIQFFIPPVEEQKSIVLQIQKQITDIEKSIRNAENLITLLQERKQIIINEVVTGKVRVS